MGSQRIVPCIWLDDQAEAAASFYAATFPNGRIEALMRYPRGAPNPAGRPPGSVLTVDFSVAGLRLTLLNAGPSHRPNPSVSFHVVLPEEEAVDALHAVLVEGGMEAMPLGAYPWSPRYAWVQDRFGVSWQLMARADVAEATALPALMFAGPHHGRARDAITLYATVFPDTRVGHVTDFGEDEGGEAGTVKQAALDLFGQPLVAMDGGAFHAFGFDEGVSLQVYCTDQAEVDRFASALAAEGGEEGPCGWVRDRFGLWWKVVPEVVQHWLTVDDEAARERVFHALMPMRRLDLATLERAFRGAGDRA